MSVTRRVAWLTPCFLFWTACGGAPPAASPAEGQPAQHSAPQAAPTVQASAEPTSTQPAQPPETAPGPEASSQPVPAEAASSSQTESSAPQEASDHRRPIDVLTSPMVAFMIDYAGSAPKEAAEQTCREKEADNLEARAQCIQKARADFSADVLVFKKAGTRWSWIIYRRNRSALLEVSTTQVDFADEKANSVVIKVKGDKGQRPLFAGQKDVTVSVPSNSSIEFNDPKLGHLVYEARVGLVASD